MNNILAFGASNSRNSINQQLAIWAANQLESAEVTALNLNDFEMPIYSMDREKEDGIPTQAVKFKELIKAADGIIISLAEYNGTFTSAFKNIYDWASRVDRATWENKPVLLLSTSPGPRGGLTVLETAKTIFPFQGAQISGTFALPSFQQNFDANQGITDSVLKADFKGELDKFQVALDQDKIDNDRAA